MGISHSFSTPHVPCIEGTPNLVFCMKIELTLVNMAWYEPQGSGTCCQKLLQLHYAPEEGNGTIKKQWIPPPRVCHPVSRAKKVVKVLYFVSNLRVDLVRNGMM